MLDHEALKDDNEKGVIKIIDDIAGYAKNLPAIKKMARTLFSRCKEYILFYACLGKVLKV